MIHQYQNNGYNIVLDVNSGAVHVVDQEAYDVIAVLNEMNAEHTPETLKAPETETVLKEKLGDRYTEEDLKDILDAVTELTEQGRLFTKDIYENLIGIVKQRKTVVKALCLHIAHDCNLACQYCFAEEGEYHGRRALMSYEVGKKALDFRGAGNLLGEAQSGHMAAVGYDLYCKMLNEAVKELKGEKEEDQFTTTMDLNIDAFIPESYIKNEYQKLDIYKRIAAITTEEEMDDMTEELIDRFGDIPKKVQQLLHIAALKSLAHAAYVTAVEQKGSDFKFTLYEKAKLDPQKIPGLLQRYGNKLVFRAEEPPYFFYQKKGRSGKETGEDTIQLLRKILEDIRELRIVP